MLLVVENSTNPKTITKQPKNITCAIIGWSVFILQIRSSKSLLSSEIPFMYFKDILNKYFIWGHWKNFKDKLF